MIGLARLITDYVTVVWLTDVYVLLEWQGQGLGSWLNKCIKEYVDMMPYLRRLSLGVEHIVAKSTQPDSSWSWSIRIIGEKGKTRVAE